MRVITRTARRYFAATLAACACLGAGAATADSGDDAVRKANGMAYELALKCFVANGVARGNSRDAHDDASAASFEKRARQSFDIAGALGDKLGYSGNRQTADFSFAQSEFLPKFVMDRKYLERTEETCKSVGL
jgi:hypothetical protein